jgi:hypothetical protein
MLCVSVLCMPAHLLVVHLRKPKQHEHGKASRQMPFDTAHAPQASASAEQCGDPQVFLGGLLIGGAEELQAALSDGSFKDALDGSNEPALPADLREAVDRTLAQHPAVRPARHISTSLQLLLYVYAAEKGPCSRCCYQLFYRAECSQEHMPGMLCPHRDQSRGQAMPDVSVAAMQQAAVPRPLLPDGMSEERYSHLQGIARRIGEG